MQKQMKIVMVIFWSSSISSDFITYFFGILSLHPATESVFWLRPQVFTSVSAPASMLGGPKVYTVGVSTNLPVMGFWSS